MRFSVFLLFLTCAPGVFADSNPSSAEIEFFEKHIRPIFVEHCVTCHGSKKQSGDLRLDSKAAFLKGGENGPIVMPGEPDKSTLVKAVRQSGDLKMPPKKKLSNDAIEVLASWVRNGAKYPNDAKAVAVDSTKSHWAFQRPKPIEPPATKISFSNPIDRFVQAKLEANGLRMAAQADRRTLIRRVTHDLTGLFPTVQELDAFVNDPSPMAYANLVDRLLASPHYGEQQARHWMDLARYSDTKGYVFEEDRNYPFAYTYRDWLIRSFNDDMPYDRFVMFQLAADRMVKDDKANLAAMGFLTVGRRFLNNPHDIIDDRLDVTFRTFQGLTVTCARCHDHKYDPIPTKDYYSLYGVFASSQEPRELPLIEQPKDSPEVKAFEVELKKRDDEARMTAEKLRATYVAKLKTPETIASYLLAVRDGFGMGREKGATIAAERKLFASVLESWRNYIGGRPQDDPVFRPFMAYGGISEAEFTAKAESLLTEIKKAKLHPAVAAAFANPPKSMRDVCEAYGKLLGTPGDDNVLAGVLGTGGPLDLNDRQFMRVFTVAEQQNIRALRRKADEWKAKSPDAPPRAMVMTEGVPTHPVVFLRGNPNNRGATTPRQFLDVVAGAARKPFSDGSGRLEMAKLIADSNNPLTARVMVNRIWGHLFGQGIVRTPSDFGVRCDPPTHPELLDWLATAFVTEGWSIKKLHRLIVTSATYRQDSMIQGNDPENRLLARMNRKRLTFEGFRDNLLLTAGRLDERIGGKSVDLFKEPSPPRRTLYGFIDRQNLPGTFRSFDLALPDTHAPQRFSTTVPQQALFLMNSPFVMEQAKALAVRSGAEKAEQRVANMCRIAFGRLPRSDEAAAALEFVNIAPDRASLTQWEQLAQVLLLSNEFAFVD